MSDGEKLGRRKEQAIAALLSCATLTEAAAASRVSTRTLQRWLRDEQFAERIRRVRATALESTVDQLRRASGSAVETLVRITKDPKAPASSQVSAARCILDFKFRGIEITDLVARIERLENQGGKRP